jgi:hypothetical protein
MLLGMVTGEGYGRVNDVLNGIFFDGRDAGRPLYLVLDNEKRAIVAAQLGVVEEQLEGAICACVGAILKKAGDPYAKALFQLRMWRKVGMSIPPPFTAILFALSHAAAKMEGDDYTGKNNYYTRLAQLTLLDRSMLSLHGKSTEALWAGLNEWLLQHNYELGRPTARALNAWVYVGYALSQAIVRAGDREQFHDLFQRFGFSGNEPISTKEMGFYLSHWMSSSRPSTRLRKGWKDLELRERIIEAALAELSAWGSNGSSSSGPGMQVTRPSRLSLLANVVDGLMGRKLELRLGRSGDGIHEGPFFLDDRSHAYHLANEDFGTFATLSPSPLGSENLGLSQIFKFQRGNRCLDWQPRLIVPFSLSPSGQWIEVARASFGAPHIVLVRDANNLPRKVEAFLVDAAITHPTKETSSNMRGLPSGWVLYSNVQVRQPTSAPPKDLECLVPLATEGHLAITGGMQLLQGFYHSQVGLEARFFAPQGPTHIEALVSGDDTRPALADASSNSAECIIAVSPSQAGTTLAIRLKAWHGEGKPDFVEVFLRDANIPTPLGRDGKGRLSFKSAISATPAVEASGLSVQGFSVSGDLPTLGYSSAGGARKPPSGEFEKKQEALLSQALAGHVRKQTCVERGFHYWRCETLPPGKPPSTPLEQCCTGCELSLIVRDRGKKEATALPSVIGNLRPPHGRPVIVPRINHDLLVDALSFLGSGSWGKLQSLIDNVGDDSVMPRSVAQDLFLLGFIDIELRTGSNTIKSWCVPSPSLVFNAPDEAFLTGFRSQRLLDDIEQAVEQAGGCFERQSRDDRPSKVVISGLDANVATQALSAVRDPHGRAVTVNEDAASCLVRACAALSPVDAVMAPVSIGRPDNLEWFDARKAQWEKASIARKAGAYRWNEGLQYYAYRNTNGDSWSGPYQLVKLLAARNEGVHLHGYDVSNKCFLASLGSDVPGLLGRALVSCTGNLPKIGQGLVSYANVPPTIADYVLNILYAESSCFHEEIKSHQRF